MFIYIERKGGEYLQILSDIVGSVEDGLIVGSPTCLKKRKREKEIKIYFKKVREKILRATEQNIRSQKDYLDPNGSHRHVCYLCTAHNSLALTRTLVPFEQYISYEKRLIRGESVMNEEKKM